MPTFEVEVNGRQFEVNAPTPRAAKQAAMRLVIQQAGQQEREAKSAVAKRLQASAPVVGEIAGGIAGGFVGGGNPLVTGMSAAGGRGLGEIVRRAGEIPGAVMDVARNLASGDPSVIDATQQGAMEGIAEGAKGAAITGGTAAAMQAVGNVIPRQARASENFQRVMSKAGQVPVDISEAGNIALRIQQLADRGAPMPSVVRKFLQRVTDPSKPTPTYEEIRDFGSNVSRLSADEARRLSPVVRRELGNLRVALNNAAGKAAASVGEGARYADAMREYAQASGLRDAGAAVVDGMKRTVPFATAAAAGAWGANKLRGLVGGGD